MDDMFDIGGILTEEEAKALFEETPKETEVPEENEQKETKAEEETQDTDQETGESPEKVGEEEINEIEENAITQQGDGSSPNVYSSIAKALKNDGIFPEFSDDELDTATTPESFAELFEKAISKQVDARLSDAQKRISQALDDGIEPGTIRSYETRLGQLNAVTEEAIKDESEEGENLRRYLIYNDFISRGFSQDKARKEVEKSFKTQSDIDDAKDALESLKGYYQKEYDSLREAARQDAEKAREEQKKQGENLKKMILEDPWKIGEMAVDTKTRQKIYDAVSKPVYKDPDSGKLLTEVQRLQKESPLEFIRQVGMWYVMTNGGKDLTNFTKNQLRQEKNKSIAELERKLNPSTIMSEGSLGYPSSKAGTKDLLESDDWKVGW